MPLAVVFWGIYLSLDKKPLSKTMRFTNPNLQQLTDTGLNSSEELLRAKAQNFELEQRIEGERLVGYEALFPAVSNWTNWESRHVKAYLENHIHPGKKLEGVSDCFLPINQPAQLGKLEGNQWLLRLETLDTWIFTDNPSGIDSFDKLKAKWGRIKGAGKAHGVDKDALRKEQQKIDDFFAEWAALADCRPVYAGLKSELQSLIEKDDWAHAYRNALGLGHISPKNNETIYVALMCYKVEDVQTQALRMRVQGPFSYPTVLDAQFNPYFTPSPLGKPYGAALDLQDLPLEQRRLFSEVLHLPIPYQFKHILKLGEIKQPVSGLESNLSALRASHIERMAAA
jgi:hypothetical protein